MKLIDILYFPFPDYMYNHFGGFASYNAADKRFRVIIDSRQPEELQMRFLKHEYGHIMCGHILSAESEPADGSWETAADAYADAMTEAEFSVLLSLSNQVHLDGLPEGMPEVIPA